MRAFSLADISQAVGREDTRFYHVNEDRCFHLLGRNLQFNPFRISANQFDAALCRTGGRLEMNFGRRCNHLPIFVQVEMIRLLFRLLQEIIRPGPEG